MIRILFFLLVVFALGLGFAWLADRPGDMVVTLDGYQYQVSLMVAAVAIQRRQAGDERAADLAQGLTALGALYQDQGRYDLADSTLQQALALARGLAQPHPVLTGVLAQLSELYRQRGQYAAAARLYRAAGDAGTAGLIEAKAGIAA